MSASKTGVAGIVSLFAIWAPANADISRCRTPSTPPKPCQPRLKPSQREQQSFGWNTMEPCVPFAKEITDSHV